MSNHTPWNNSRLCIWHKISVEFYVSKGKKKSNDGLQNENDKLVATKPEQPQDPAEKLHILKVLLWRWDTGHRHFFSTTLCAVFYSLNNKFLDCCDGAWLSFTRILLPFPTKSKETRLVVVEKISAMNIITCNSGKFRYTQSDKRQLPESLVFQEDPEKVVTEKMEHQGNIMNDISTGPG